MAGVVIDVVISALVAGGDIIAGVACSIVPGSADTGIAFHARGDFPALGAVLRAGLAGVVGCVVIASLVTGWDGVTGRGRLVEEGA